MSKVISVNAGSSSLKFQLFNMPEEEVLTSGVAERIGLDEGIFTINRTGCEQRLYCRGLHSRGALRACAQSGVQEKDHECLQLHHARHRRGRPFRRGRSRVAEPSSLPLRICTRDVLPMNGLSKGSMPTPERDDSVRKPRRHLWL